MKGSHSLNTTFYDLMNLLNCKHGLQKYKNIFISLMYVAYFAFNQIFVHLRNVHKLVSSHLAAFWPFRQSSAKSCLFCVKS